MRLDRAAALSLVVAATAGLLLYNFGPREWFDSIFHSPLTIQPIDFHLDLKGLVAEFLLGFFFLLAGIELRRDMQSGQHGGGNVFILPALAALFGAIVPALFFWFATSGDATASQGWAIPMATDITFAIAVYSVFGSKMPSAGRTFLLTFAIIDDLIAILVIALFLGREIDPWWLVGLTLMLVIVPFASRANHWLLLPIGLFAWYFAYRSGVQPAIVGAFFGALLPVRFGAAVERAVLRPVMFGVLPLFALIALAIPLDSGVNLDSPITHGILLRPLGKVLGITFGVILAIWLSKRRGFPELRISDFVRISVLGGIGFTVALFVSESVYGSGSSSQATANISTLLVTILCVAIGAVLLRTRKPNQAGATNS